MLMKPRRPVLYSYAVAVLTVSVATALKLLLAPAIDNESPFLIYFAAVMLTAWRGGLLPGLLATLLAAAISDYLFLTPTYTLLGHDTGQDLRLLLFVAEGTLISVLSVALCSDRRSESHTPLILRCGVAVMSVAAVFGLKLLLDPLITAESPFLLFFSIVIFSVWYGGLVPGLLAVLVSAVLCDYFFLSPTHSLLSKDFGQNLRLGIFVCEGTLITVLGWEARKSAMRERDVLFSLSPNMVGKINHDGYFEHVNPAFARLLGFTEKELMAQPLGEFVHADDRSKYTAEISKLRDGMPVSNFEIRLLGPDSSNRWFSWSVARVEEGDSLYAVAQDLTVQKESEEYLRASERRYRNLVESVPAIVYEANAQPPYSPIYVSPNIESLGYQLADWYNATDLWLNLIHPDDRERVAQATEEAKRLQHETDYEYRVITSNGAERWIHDRGRFVFDADSHPVRWQGVLVDITEQKLAEEKLSNAVSLLKTTLDSTDDGILVVDTRGKVTLFNDKFAKMWRIPADVIEKREDELLIKVVLDQLKEPEEFLRRIEELYANLQKVSLDILEFKDGRVYERYGQPQTLDGQTVGHVWNFRDVTERERAEAALRHSERHYRSLIENSSDVITVLDADGLILYQSPSIRHWRGFEPSELISRQVRDFVHADDLPAIEEGLACKLSQPGVPIKFECRMRHKDGSWRHVEGTSVNLLTDPAIGGIIINTRDTTERKQMEAALRESEERLRQALRMEAAGQLAGGIAHDFNNILTVINGYSELLLHRPVIDERAREKVSQIHKAGVRAAALTRQLLAFSRKQMLQPKLLDINALVSDLHTLLQRLIGEHIRVSLALDASAGLIKADPGQIEQVIINLAINARDAMPEGGALTIETGNVVFDEASADDEEAVPPGEYVTLVVSDTGVGMTAEVKGLAFEPFFTTKEHGKGTGLGLSTVYGIVTQSGGNIRVESEQDVGTTLRIYLPRVDEPFVPTATPPPPHAAPRGAETILLVEDEQEVRVMAREILEASGYRVIVAGHGEEALEVSEKHRGTIHLLVTDIVMPRMGGRLLAERLLAARPGLKVLYISGYTDDMIVRRDVQDADIAYLPKPFTPGDLKTKVRDVMDAK